MTSRCNKSGKDKKTFNFDGLIVEVVDSEVETGLENMQNTDEEAANATSNEPLDPGSLICSICEDNIRINYEWILEPCEHCFCRLCLAQAIIDCESDVINCPSKSSNCDKEIGPSEIQEILGEVNFGAYLLNRLETRMHSLIAKDEADFLSM